MVTSMRACRGHRDGDLFPLSLSRGEFLSRADLPSGPTRLPGTQIFLHPVSLHDSVHPLFLSSLRHLHLQAEARSTAKSAEATGVSAGHDSQGSFRRAR